MSELNNPQFNNIINECVKRIVLEDEDKSFVPNPQWMSEKYDEMNSWLFNGKLGACDFGIFTTGRGSGGGVLGWFKITGRNIKADRYSRRMFVESFSFGRNYIEKDNFVDLCKPRIELNGNYRGAEKAFLATLVHEMCHYYTYMNGWAPRQGHGTEFKNIAYAVSSRSNGMFTIQRIATAEQMNELELNDTMKAKKEKRLANKKSGITAVIRFMRNGEVQLTNTSNSELINRMVGSHKNSDVIKVVTSNDSNLIDLLFANRKGSVMRTWRYWDVTNEPWVNDLENYDIETFEKEKPEQKQTFTPIAPPTSSKKMFIIKTNKGVFKIMFSNEEELRSKLKERFPKMSDEGIDRIMKNPANYVLKENKRSFKDIVNEVIDEIVSDKQDEIVSISPDMNLGLYSPLQLG